ncbi:MAG: hypothetical protein ABJB47_22840 [Actinomycetota bacterium]
MSAAFALALAACGGSSSPSASTPASSSPASSSAPPAPASSSSAPDTSSSSGGSGGLTPPGTHLAFGQPAIVRYIPVSDTSTAAKKGIKLQVTVESIQKGTIADFANVQLNKDEKKSTPYYVKLRVKALTGVAPPTSTDDPAFVFDAIDDRGQKQGAINFIGTFQRCSTVSMPKHFVSGKSYDTCFAYLIPGGGSIQKEQWGDGPVPADGVSVYFEKPLVWSN